MYTVFLHACICDSVRKPLYLIFASSSILLSPLFHHCHRPFIVRRVIVHPQWPSFPYTAALSKLRASYMAVHVLQLYPPSSLLCVCLCSAWPTRKSNLNFISLGTQIVWCLSTVYHFISWLDVVRTKLIHWRLRQFLRNVWSTWKISQLGAALLVQWSIMGLLVASWLWGLLLHQAPSLHVNRNGGEGEPCASVRLPCLWDWKSHVWVPIVARHFFSEVCSNSLQIQ